MLTACAFMLLASPSLPEAAFAEQYLIRNAERKAVIARYHAADNPEYRERLYRVYRTVTIRDIDAFAARRGGYFNPLDPLCPWVGAWDAEQRLVRFPEFVCLPPGEYVMDEESPYGQGFRETTVEQHKSHCRRMLILYALRTGDMFLVYYQLETGQWPPLVPRP